MEDERAPTGRRVLVEPELARTESPTPLSARAGVRWSASIVEGKVSSRDFAPVPRQGSLDDISVRTNSPAARRSSQSSPAGSRPMFNSGANRGFLCTSEPNEEDSPHVRPTSGTRRGNESISEMIARGMESSLASPMASSPNSSRTGRRHSVSSATIPMRYVEWTPADEPSRRRGRMIVQSERNVDFLQRLKERQLRAGALQSSDDVAFAERLLSDNFLFSQMAPQTLRLMIDAMQEVTVKEGETLFSVGDNDDKLYLLIEGKLALAIPTHVAKPLSSGGMAGGADDNVSSPIPRLPRSPGAGTAAPRVPAAAIAAADEAARSAAEKLAAAPMISSAASPLGSGTHARRRVAGGVSSKWDMPMPPPPPSRCMSGKAQPVFQSETTSALLTPPIPARCNSREGSRACCGGGAAACDNAQISTAGGIASGLTPSSGSTSMFPCQGKTQWNPKSANSQLVPTLMPPSSKHGGFGAVVTILRRGATFGEMALLHTRRRTATVVAACRSRIWALSRSAYLDVLVNMPIDGIDVISMLRSLPLFQTEGSQHDGRKRLFPSSLDTRVYRVGCAMQASSHTQGAVVLELRPWSNVLLLVRSGSLRHGRNIIPQGSMVVSGRPLDVALCSVAAELTGQPVVHATWGSEVPCIVAEEDSELLAISLQEFVLLLGASEELLTDPRAIRRLLRDVPDLTALSDDKLEQLAACAAVRSFEAGEKLCSTGEVAERVHVLVDGQMQVQGSDVNLTIIGEIASVEVLGVRSAILGEPCAASIVTLTRCVTICFNAQEFKDVAISAALAQSPSPCTRWEGQPSMDPASITHVIGVIGQGAYGPVQLCQLEDGESVCIKLMRRDAVTEDRQQTAVMTEVELLREIHHPFVVTLLGTVKTERYLGLVLEPLLGGDLFQHLTTRPGGTVTPDAALFYSSCVISALGHLHARHIVFRDLKPENVMLKPDGYVKLIDFGYAKRLVERTYSVVGTVEYLAPEVIMQRGHRFGADWWSLGILIYEMVAGFTPFTNGGTEANEMEICKNITSPGFRIDFPPDLPTYPRDAIERLLTREPLERLGCGGGSSRDVIQHAFFRTMDFEALVLQALSPPFIPAVDSEEDITHFGEFSDRPIDLLHDPPYESDASRWDFYF